MTIRRITAATGTIVSVAEARQVLGLTDAPDAGDDVALAGLCEVVTALAEQETQRVYRSQSLEWGHDGEGWNYGMRLPLSAGGGPGNINIDSVKYYDLRFTQQTLDPLAYWAGSDCEAVTIVPRLFSVWPFLGDGPEIVTVAFSVKATVSVPSQVKQAALLMLCNLWRMGQRGPFVTMESSVGIAQTQFSVTTDAAAVQDKLVQRLLAFDRWD